ncbi:MAG: hypothetical protein ABL879_03465 [Devosia sp.]
MRSLIRAFSLLPALALTACAVMAPQSTTYSSGNGSLMGAEDTALIPANAPAAAPVATASSGAMSDISSYVDAAALKALSNTSRTQAAGAQFNALQFGRVGAPRNWVGDNGASGQVTVGPYIRVNLIDCRDFTHTVTINGTAYSRKGTACRETDGSWTVT